MSIYYLNAAVPFILFIYCCLLYWQVEYYISQSEADNHAVREAACACIAELGSKIDKECVRSHVPRLLDALKVCFEDDSWPVRDGLFRF